MTMLSRMRARDPLFDCFSRGKSCGVQWSDMTCRGGGIVDVYTVRVHVLLQYVHLLHPAAAAAATMPSALFAK
jgi:hypothetical protein